MKPTREQRKKLERAINAAEEVSRYAVQKHMDEHGGYQKAAWVEMNPRLKTLDSKAQELINEIKKVL